MNESTTSFKPDALRHSRLFESSDLDYARARISAVMQPHSLRSRGGPYGGRSSMDFVRIAGVGLGSIRFGEPVQVDTGRIAGYHLLMFCTEGRANVRVDGIPLTVDRHRGMVCPPGRPFMAELSADCEQFVLRLDEQAVRGHTGVEHFSFRHDLDLARPELQAWVHQMHAVATSKPLIDCLQGNALIATEFERLTLMLLLAGQPRAVAGSADGSRMLVPRTVRLAESFIEENVENPIRLQDIAAAAGVPVRTLLDAFKRFREHTPIQHLHGMRLERAHHLLRHADAGTRVATVAMDCGFLHLGRFAACYQKRFGVSPSATLRGS